MDDHGVPIIPLGGSMHVGAEPPSVSVENGAWHIQGEFGFRSIAVGIFFSSCVDARSYAGVRFTYTGSAPPCGGTFAILDSAHTPPGGSFPNASGPADARVGWLAAPPPWYPAGDGGQIPAVTVRIPFKDLLGLKPQTPLDPAQLIGVQWGFASPDSCRMDLWIDDVMFYADTDTADAGADGAAAETFPCGTESCRNGSEYCFREQWNGAVQVAPVCRSLPSGCTTCSCAKPDAQSISMMCKTPATLTCTDGAKVIDEQTSTPTLAIRCDVA